MQNNNFPELDSWDEIRKEPMHGDALGVIDATHRLVMSITNLRSAVSSQVGYLKNKVERLQKSVDSLSENIKTSIDDFNNASSRLYKVNIWLTAIIAYATLMNVVVSLDLDKIITATIAVIAIILCWFLVQYLFKK